MAKSRTLDTRKRPVLIVDDVPDVRAALAFFIQDAGYPTETAQNGAEALAKLRDGVAPCLILLDLQMPVMDGFQFRAEQRADPTLAHIPVVAFSGHPTPEENMARLGVVAYFQKPAEPDYLLKLIEQHRRS